MKRANDAPELVALRDLHRIVLLVHSAVDLGDVLDTAARGVVDVIGFEEVCVNLLTDRGDFEVVTDIGSEPGVLLGSRTAYDIFMAELAVGDVWGELCFVPEGRHRPHLDEMSFWMTDLPPTDAPDAWLPGDALYAPLKDPRGEVVGILSVDMPHDRRRPGRVRRTMLELFAVQIGLAISHARERDRLARRLRLSMATQQILQAVAASRSLDDLLEWSVAPLQESYGGERTWIRLFADPGGSWGAVNFPARLADDLDEAARRGLETDLGPLDTGRALASAQRVAARCWESQRTLLVSRSGPDTSADVLGQSSRQRVVEWLAALDHQQFVLVPLGVGDQCVGYVAFNRREDLDWSAIEEEAALDVGRELGGVIGAARLRAREDQLRARLEDLDDYKNRVVTTIIHELKNPLAVVMGNLELAVDEPALAEKAHAAIARGAGRMQSLVEDLLTLTRLREPVVELDRTTLDLSGIVREVLSLVADQADLADVALDGTGVEPDVKVRSERSEMDRLVLNLVSNAIKYSSAGDSVSVSLRAEPDRVELTCADTGLGISSDDISSIFDEFDRSTNPSARSRPGSGLGLPIVRRIVQRHGGSIDVTSQLGHGSRFVVSLPTE